MELDIEFIRTGIGGIDSDFANYMATSVVVCLNSQNHTNGVTLNVENVDDKKSLHNFPISWTTTLNNRQLASYRDENRTTDFGAMCVAILLALKLTEYKYFITSETNNGIDFWLTNNEDDLDFEARLEVSGIRQENNTNTIRHRLATKINSTKVSDYTNLPAFICITEFGSPRSVFVKR